MRIFIALIAILSIMLMCGCTAQRFSYIVQMQDRKPVVLNNQYRLEGFYDKCGLRYDPLTYQDYQKSAEEIRQVIETELHNLLPRNFTSSGRPFRINIIGRKDDDHNVQNGMTILMFLCSLGIFPALLKSEEFITYEVQLLDGNERGVAFEIDAVYEEVNSWIPLGLSLGEDIHTPDNYPVFCSHAFNVVNPAYVDVKDRVILRNKSIAYAVALKLMEMEAAEAASASRVAQQATPSANLSTPIHQQQSALPTPASPQPVSPPAVAVVTATQQPQPVSTPPQRLYRIVESERESGEIFARRFVLEVLGDIDVSTERAIRREYIEDLKLDYAETYGLADLASIYVDFTQFSLKDRRIEGRAVVFTATPDTTMQYDANTRRGKITVRFNSAVRGTDWARGWARRNIETLVRDKNILLTTGEKPPEGHYLSRGEQWHGDVLEIEFETE